ncbi:phosphatidate cytidylyltransferase, mitochondrial-like [Watersipora subatra]|uniref:phosphatidate cytidylyltransferase, mitochondrial-like n=1 Tax=Watersipora subatra TaxID=2589382 RepID=UPI00355B693F
MAKLQNFARDVLHRFPSQHIQFAFCYGSAAFQQKGSVMTSNVLDFILVVDSCTNFHSQNLRQNFRDYAFLKYFGSDTICKLQGTGVYFNTLVPFGGRTIKYGVVSSLDFKSDLLDWTTLYLSGRLHKPVQVVHKTADKAVNAALTNNLKSAVHTSLLLLPDSFSETDLFMTIASLSYSGDFRMTVGEDKNKISNIVTPNIDHFKALYGEILDKEENLLWNKENGTFEQIPNFATRFHHLNLLPWGVQERLAGYRNKDGRYRDMEEVIRLLATDGPGCQRWVRRSVSDIVRASSWNQTVKSALAAGVVNSIKYASAKLKKMAKSMTK